jgi:hypothetical protein
MTDTMGDESLRVRAVVGEYFVPFVIVLVVLAGLGGFLVYGAYAQTTERTETTVTNEVTWTSTGQFTHQATVVNDTRVFDVGETLENRSAYFRKITPRLNGSFVYTYTATSGELNARASTTLVVRAATEEKTGAQGEYWRIKRPLDRTTTTLAPGETLRQSFTQNVSRLVAEIGQIQTELGTTAGTTKTTFVTTVQLDGTRNGRTISANRTYRLPLTVENGIYRVNDSGPVVEQGERPNRTTETAIVQAGPLWRYGGPLALLAGLVGLLGLAYGRYSGQVPLTERERAYLEYRTDRTAFDEWITEARFRDDRVEAADTHVETASLSGLVDLAIDTDRRVIEVTEQDRYLVHDGDVVYSYDAPTLRGTGDPLEPRSASADGATTTADETVSDSGRGDDGTGPDSDSGSTDSEAKTEGSVFARLQKRAGFGDDGQPSGESRGERETCGKEGDADEN